MEIACQPRIVRFGAFEANLDTHELCKHGIKLKLHDQPFQVLELLLEHRGELVTRELLCQKLWPSETFVDFENGLRGTINRLREALGDSATNPRFVETLPRRGYRFIATVDSTVPRAREVAKPASSKRVRRLMAVVGAITLLVAVVRFNVRSVRDWLLGKPPFVRIQSVVVLPLVNLTGDAAQEYFVDGMTDVLITSLAQLHSLNVISRTSAMRYKNSQKSLLEIAKELNVDAVVEGSVARSEGRVRINAQLIQARTDRHLWAKSYDGNLSDIVALQNDISLGVANEVRVKLSPREQARLARALPIDPESYEAYLKGNYTFWDKWTPEGLQMAVRYFEHAIEKDPNYALPHAGLAVCYTTGWEQGASPSRERVAKARAEASRALELDDQLAEPHLAMALVRANYDWDWPGAEKEFRRAIELNPNSARVHDTYAFSLSSRGEIDHALKEITRALELDPLSPIANHVRGAILFRARRYDDAIAQFRKTLDLDPNFNLTHGWLWRTYEETKQYDQAFAEYMKGKVLSEPPEAAAALREAYRSFGMRGFWRKRVELLKEKSKHRRVPPIEFARFYARLEDRDQAFAWLETAYADRSPNLTQIKVDPQFDSLHSDPRFADLLHRIGQEP